MRTRRSGVRGPGAALLAGAALLHASCGAPGGSGPDDGAGDGGASRLEGTYVATDLDDPRRRIEPGSTIRLTFSGDDLAVAAGCNHLSGEATVEGGVLRVSELGGTEMACEPPLLAQDAWVTAMLTARPEVTSSGGTLTLTSGGTTLRLEEQRVEHAPVEGTRWQLESLVEGSGDDGSVSSVPPAAADAMLVIESGTLRITYGCTTVTAPVRLGEATITLGEISTAVRDCAPRLPALERHVKNVLTGRASYVVTGSRLMVTGSAGDLGLGFVAR